MFPSLRSPALSRRLLLCSAALAACTLAAETGPRAFDAIPASSLGNEVYDPALEDIDSLDKAEAYVRSTLAGANPSRVATAAAIDRFVQRRFAHGQSHFALRENWVARAAGLLWDDLAMPITPDEVLKHRTALCSQQAMVAQALLRRFSIHFASVRFRNPGHFALAAQVEGGWRFYDPDMQPAGRTPLALDDVVAGRGLAAAYKGEFGPAFAGAGRRGDIAVTDYDGNPAVRGAAFERATRFLSGFGWLIFGLGWLGTAQTARTAAVRRLVPAISTAARSALRAAFGGGTAHGTR